MFSVEFRYRVRKIYNSVKQIVELVSNVLLFLASFLAIICCGFCLILNYYGQKRGFG